EGDRSGLCILLFDVLEATALIELNFANPLVAGRQANSPGLLSGWRPSGRRRAKLHAQLAEPPWRVSRGSGLKMPDDGIQQVRHNYHSVHRRRHKKFLSLPRGNTRVAFPLLLDEHETDLEFHSAGTAVFVQ